MIPVAFLLESFWQDWEMSSRVGSSCVPSLLEESMPSECPLPILRDLPCWWSTAFFCFLFLEVLQTHGGFTPRSTPLLHSFLFRAFRLRRCGVWFVRSSFSGLCHWWLGEDAGGLLPTAKFRWCQESHWFLLLLVDFALNLPENDYWEMARAATTAEFPFETWRENLIGAYTEAVTMFRQGDNKSLTLNHLWVRTVGWVPTMDVYRVYIFVYLWFQYPYWSIKLARSF